MTSLRSRDVLIFALVALLPAGCALRSASPVSTVDSTSLSLKATSSLQTLYTFDGSDGSDPQSPMAEDAGGNIYGSTYAGGPQGGGVAFELVKASGYAETILYPFGSPVMDASGNLYYSTYNTVVKLVPTRSGKYSARVLGTISSEGQPLWTDSTGAIYGATTADGGYGTVFQITPK